MTPLRWSLACVLAALAVLGCGGESIVSEANHVDAGTGGTSGQGGTGGADAGGAAGQSGTGGGSAGAASPPLQIDSVNVQLVGVFGPYPQERSAAAPAAIAALTSDVVCVQEAWGSATRAAILSGTAGTFPHRAVFDFNLDTADPPDRQGVVPPPHLTAACATPGLSGDFAEVADCIQENCVSPKNDPSSKPASDVSACLTTSCLNGLWPFVTGTDDDKACYDCIFLQLMSSASPNELRAACTQDPRARFAWNGNTGTFLLSRYPIVDSEAWVLPSTELRMIVARATVSVPKGNPVDVYCTSLTTPATGTTRPYTGHYGGTATSSGDAWVEEQSLQAERLVSVIQQSMAVRGRGGVLVGTLSSGPAYPEQNLQQINVRAFNTVNAAFPLAVPAGYVPACTLCMDNPILTDGQPPAEKGGSWQSFVFLAGTPALNPVGASVILKEKVVGLSSQNGTYFKAPISVHYGFRSSFAITQ